MKIGQGKLGLDQQGPRPDPPHAVLAWICGFVQLLSPAPVCLLPFQELGPCPRVRPRLVFWRCLVHGDRTTGKVLKHTSLSYVSLPIPSNAWMHWVCRSLQSGRNRAVRSCSIGIALRPLWESCFQSHFPHLHWRMALSCHLGVLCHGSFCFYRPEMGSQRGS